jgi:hypothetical protein
MWVPSWQCINIRSIMEGRVSFEGPALARRAAADRLPKPWTDGDRIFDKGFQTKETIWP